MSEEISPDSRVTKSTLKNLIELGFVVTVIVIEHNDGYSVQAETNTNGRMATVDLVSGDMTRKVWRNVKHPIRILKGIGVMKLKLKLMKGSNI